MILLGLETSCDETSAAIIEGEGKKTRLLAQSIATSLSLHAETGGIIPEVAARQQMKYMLPVISDVCEKAFGKRDIKEALAGIDAIAVTYGPGLIGSLLVGVETARTISMVLDKPVVPVNHMVGHIYANFVSIDANREKESAEEILFPAVVLVVSGGHTDLLLMKDHGDLKLLGGTRDDAAGEAFDKIARLLDLPYPGGPSIEKAALSGEELRFKFPRPLLDSNDYEFSFSGLKTAVLREVKEINKLDKKTVSDIALGAQSAVVDVLVKKTFRATKEFNAKSILLSGGVAANQALRKGFIDQEEKQNITIHMPEKKFCTDNAAMIGAAGYFNYHPVPWKELNADPELYFT